eukprot:TRINITY_DN9272_c0_g1_i1.p1 TRINITY_DN9272_c0_g1~~TRINITY_DN9272_c0_g1_i1.p1  ORF type:complete len:304 (-),score=19.66 TRINITY_DN9272_c0_g1_i1:414-1325(-)
MLIRQIALRCKGTLLTQPRPVTYCSSSYLAVQSQATGSPQLWSLIPLTALIAGATYVYKTNSDTVQQEEDEKFLQRPERVQELIQQLKENNPKLQQQKLAGQYVRQHILGKLFMQGNGQDYLFAGLLREGQETENCIIQKQQRYSKVSSKNLFERFDKDNHKGMLKHVTCFYDDTRNKYYCILHFGDNVCGYPGTVHGGMSAAVLDEVFGGLYVCMFGRGNLGVRPPYFTAKLEVNYIKKVPVDSVLLIEAQVDEIEGRKLWMSASVRDQLNGKEFVQSRALFVSPKWYSFITTFVKNTFKST